MSPSNSKAIALTLASTALLAAAQSTVTRAPSASSSSASSAFTPLAAKSFSYPDGVPYQADTDNGVRGHQVGYNVCNSTTEGQDSLCQTAFINSIEDFCLWAPPEPDSVVGNTEGEMVAWCTKPGRGTRLIPEGTLQGVQFLRAPSYVQVVGFIDQTKLNIQAGDYGGEMDPHGADRRGNPLGGLLFSQAYGQANTTQWTQVVQWHNFMGGDVFCLKACDPADENDWHYCEHIFDRIGCKYNAPAAYVNGTFESCESDNQRFPGVYVNDAGNTVTYTQPPESLGVITTMPYEPEIPSSSMCTTYTSASIFTDLASVSGGNSTSAAETSSTASTSAASSAVSSAVSAASSSVSGINNAASRPTTSATPAGAASLNMAISGAAAGLAAVAGLFMLA